MFPKVLTVDQDTELHSLVLGVPLSLGDTPNHKLEDILNNQVMVGLPHSSHLEDPLLLLNRICMVGQDLEVPLPSSPQSAVPQGIPSQVDTGHLLRPSLDMAPRSHNHKAIPARLPMEETLQFLSHPDRTMEHPHRCPVRTTPTPQHQATGRDNHPRVPVLLTPTKQRRNPLLDQPETSVLKMMQTF